MKKAKSNRSKVYDQKGLKLLAKKLISIRKDKGLTQEELAYKTGLTLSQIARIETVQGNPTVSTIFTIARSLNIKPSVLFDYEL